MKAVVPDGAEDDRGKGSFPRGMRLAGIFHHRAEVLDASVDDTTAYQLSERVDRIDAFISQSVACTSRTEKFMLLALHFNLRAAIVAVLGMYLLVVASTPLGGLSVIPDSWPGVALQNRFGCNFLGHAVFLLVFFFWRDLRALVGSPGPAVFLGKTCIHQADAKLRSRGVRSLGICLSTSRSFVLVHTDAYLGQLWNVFEFTVFLASCPGCEVVILPPFLPKLIVVGSLFIFLASSASPDFYSASQMEPVCYASIGAVCAACLFAAFGLSVILRRWSRDQARALTRAKSFGVLSASCCDEADRQLLHENILDFMKKKKLMQPASSETAAFLGFDRLVQRELPCALAACFGRVGVPYFMVVAMFLDVGLVGLHSFAADMLTGASLRCVTLNALLLATMHLAVCPLFVAMVSCFAKRCLWLRGTVDIAYVSLSGCASCGFLLCAYVMLEVVSQEALNSDRALGMYLCLVVACFVQVYVWYRQPLVQRSGSSVGSPDERHAEGAANDVVCQQGLGDQHACITEVVIDCDDGGNPPAKLQQSCFLSAEHLRELASTSPICLSSFGQCIRPTTEEHLSSTTVDHKSFDPKSFRFFDERSNPSVSRASGAPCAAEVGAEVFGASCDGEEPATQSMHAAEEKRRGLALEFAQAMQSKVPEGIIQVEPLRPEEDDATSHNGVVFSEYSVVSCPSAMLEEPRTSYPSQMVTRHRQSLPSPYGRTALGLSFEELCAELPHAERVEEVTFDPVLDDFDEVCVCEQAPWCGVHLILGEPRDGHRDMLARESRAREAMREAISVSHSRGIESMISREALTEVLPIPTSQDFSRHRL